MLAINDRRTCTTLCTESVTNERMLVITDRRTEQQMLAIGRALAGGPRLLILDEPSLGLAPRVLGDIAAALGHRHELDSLPVRWQQRRQQRWQQPLVARWQADRLSRTRHARVRG